MLSNLAAILKPTLAKVGLFVAFLGVSLGPTFFFGNGIAFIVPVIEMFWLAGLGQALGLVGRGPDAFSLAPVDGIGTALVVVGSLISLAVNYVVASFIVWSRS